MKYILVCGLFLLSYFLLNTPLDYTNLYKIRLARTDIDNQTELQFQLTSLNAELEMLRKEKDSKIKDLLEANSQLTEAVEETNSIIAFENHDPGKLLFNMHFHKAAGSTICKLARFNKYKTTRTNCNYWKNQTCCGETVAQQKAVAKNLISTNSYNFIANERFLPDKLDHEFYEYMIVFRKPLERYASHYKFARDEYPEKSIGKFADWLKCQPDNYMFRNLCGNRCLKKARGDLNRNDMEYVKNKLSQFKAILILEQFDESMFIMKRKFGWKREHKVRNQGDSHDEKVYTEKDTERFKFMTTFDDELYAYAEYLNKAQIEELKHRNNYKSFSEKCETSCCCKTCSIYR